MLTPTHADSPAQTASTFTPASRAQPPATAALYLILPSLLFSAIFFYYPITSGFYHSFTYWDIKQTVVGRQKITSASLTTRPRPPRGATWRSSAISNMLIVCIFPALWRGLGRCACTMPPSQYWWRIIFAVCHIIVPAHRRRICLALVLWIGWWIESNTADDQTRRIGLKSGWGNRRLGIGGDHLRRLPVGRRTQFLIYVAALQSISQEISTGKSGWRRFV